MIEPVVAQTSLPGDAMVHQGMTAADAAREFETMLIAAWMKTAREAGALDEKQDEMTGAASYMEFAEKFLAGVIAQSGAFGFGDMIHSELQTIEAPATHPTEASRGTALERDR